MKKMNFEQMERVNGGNMKHNLCVGSMAVAGGIWALGAGMVSLGAGFIVGVGFAFLGDKVCSKVN